MRSILTIYPIHSNLHGAMKAMKKFKISWSSKVRTEEEAKKAIDDWYKKNLTSRTVLFYKKNQIDRSKSHFTFARIEILDQKWPSGLSAQHVDSDWTCGVMKFRLMDWLIDDK